MVLPPKSLILLHLQPLLKEGRKISGFGLQIVLGLFIGAFVVTQSIYLQPDTHEDKEEQSEEDSSESIQIIASQAVPSSSLQFNLGFQSYLLEEIAQTEDDQKKTRFQEKFVSTVNKALRVLLSRIIAPNAP